MVIRWRRFPLTRELLIRAKNGREFTYAADVRTPWETMRLKGPIRIRGQKHVQIHSAKLLSDAFPASRDACRVSVTPFSSDALRGAHHH